MTAEKSAKREKTIAIVALIAIVIIGAAVAFYQSSKGGEGTVTNTPSQTANDTAATNQTTTNSDSNSATTYTDGTYTAKGSYRTPEGTESVEVTVTVANNIVTDSQVTTSGNNRESVEYQTQFKENYKQYVVGKNLADISLSRVSGSSLTPNGFNQALDDIKSQATAA